MQMKLTILKYYSYLKKKKQLALYRQPSLKKKNKVDNDIFYNCLFYKYLSIIFLKLKKKYGLPKKLKM